MIRKILMARFLFVWFTKMNVLPGSWLCNEKIKSNPLNKNTSRTETETKQSRNWITQTRNFFLERILNNCAHKNSAFRNLKKKRKAFLKFFWNILCSRIRIVQGDHLTTWTIIHHANQNSWHSNRTHDVIIKKTTQK